ncbi:unnamed protein product [Linum trigynum]|uniref:SHSP domain-containing protein n=1 Tax=Linum trigynum TaxID=586398 RepID=A0AAV2GTW4_9ROSI
MMPSSSKYSPLPLLPFLLLLLLLCQLASISIAALPFTELNSVSDLWRDPFCATKHAPFVATCHARVDWKETPTGHVFSLDVPGIEGEELKIEVEENWVLRVRWREFWRLFSIPENADLNSAKAARIKNGEIIVTFAKMSPDKIEGPKSTVNNRGGRDLAAALNYKAEQEL